MTNFVIYPAVDLKDGKCVRLVHGKENKMTVYENDPIKQVKFFVANDTNLATLIKADGLYISSYNKSFKNLCFRRKNFSFIGSAHNYREIELKKKQGCEIILVSKLFKVGYDPKSSYMGITKFNKKFLFDKKIIPLGGITICNLNSLKNTNSEGFALLSEVKKKPAKIFSRLF